jgi:diaminopimelate decarboxylase
VRDYAEAILPQLRELDIRVLLEPGRFLVGNAGVLLTRVLYIKETAGKKFAIVDAGMNDLIRPALYQSYHEVVPLEEQSTSTGKQKIDIVGPVCESGDFFATDREMRELHHGDLLSIMSAGAYGFVMASNYNSRPLPAEVLVRGNKFALIRERQTWDDLVRGEVDTSW